MDIPAGQERLALADTAAAVAAAHPAISVVPAAEEAAATMAVAVVAKVEPSSAATMAGEAAAVAVRRLRPPTRSIFTVGKAGTTAKGLSIVKSVSEIGAGGNGHRPKLIGLLRDPTMWGDRRGAAGPACLFRLEVHRSGPAIDGPEGCRR